MNRPRNIDFAARFGVKKQQVQTWINQGMPVDSYESAEAWVGARLKGGAGSVALETDKEFADTISRQRHLMEVAYQQYLDDRRDPSVDASKSHGIYDKALKTLMQLEKEQTAREIASKEYIRLQTAIDRFGRVFAQVREELTQMPSKVASKCNPDNPGKAMKALDAEVYAMLTRLSASKDYAEQAVAKEPDGDDIIELPDDGEPDEIEQKPE